MTPRAGHRPERVHADPRRHPRHPGRGGSGALAELRRVLRPGGRLLVLDTDWGSAVWHSRDDERMTHVLHAWEAHLTDPRPPRTLGSALGREGFDLDSVFVLPLLNVGYAEATYSGGLIELITAFLESR